MGTKNISPTDPSRDDATVDQSNPTSQIQRKPPDGQTADRFKKILDTGEPKKKKAAQSSAKTSDEDEKPSLFGLVGEARAQAKKQMTADEDESELLGDTSDESSEMELSDDSSVTEALLQGRQSMAPPVKGDSMPTTPIRPDSSKPVVEKVIVPEQKSKDTPNSTTDPNLAAAAKAFGNLPGIQPVNIPEVAIAASKQQAPLLQTSDLKALIDQMTKAVTTITSPDQTTTTISLKYPPIFNGASLQITEYDSAQKQFNITFTDLSPDARRLIESQQNQSNLRQNLIEKGYTIQMITVETPIQVADNTGASGSNLNRDQQQAFDDETGQGSQQDTDERFT